MNSTTIPAYSSNPTFVILDQKLKQHGKELMPGTSGWHSLTDFLQNWYIIRGTKSFSSDDSCLTTMFLSVRFFCFRFVGHICYCPCESYLSHIGSQSCQVTAPSFHRATSAHLGDGIDDFWPSILHVSRLGGIVLASLQASWQGQGASCPFDQTYLTKYFRVSVFLCFFLSFILSLLFRQFVCK